MFNPSFLSIYKNRTLCIHPCKMYWFILKKLLETSILIHIGLLCERKQQTFMTAIKTSAFGEEWKEIWTQTVTYAIKQKSQRGLISRPPEAKLHSETNQKQFSGKHYFMPWGHMSLLDYLRDLRYLSLFVREKTLDWTFRDSCLWVRSHQEVSCEWFQNGFLILEHLRASSLLFSAF